MPAASYDFPPFRLDEADSSLWRGAQKVLLPPKEFALLLYLVRHSGRLVTTEELLQGVWQGISVSRGVLKTRIHRIRSALEDDAEAPRFIETVHGRGYRFIALLNPAPPVASSQYPVVSRKQAENAAPQLTTDNWQLATGLVGREAELERLHDWLAQAHSGKRRIVFVTGEPGIGKTTLVDTFLAQVAANSQVWVAHGQCVEHYGSGEPYGPVLEAIERLCRTSEGERLKAVLHQHAPLWLMQMPGLLGTEEINALQPRVMGATRDRMMRELVEALVVLTAERPLVLVLEDLHWSDGSTLELLAALARRQEQARLLVIGTYRPLEVLGTGHPLRAITQEMRLHRQCEGLSVGLLTPAHVAEYLTVRFAVSSLAGAGEKQDKGFSPAALQRLAGVIHRRTEGNPLFVVNVVDHLIAHGGLTKNADGRWELGVAFEALQGKIPEDLRQMIEQQIERLGPEDQRLLEVAGVVGMEFSAATVAAMVGSEIEQVEERCEGLVRKQFFLRTHNEWQEYSGRQAAWYEFLHTLYHEVWYERVTSGRRVRLHRQMGVWEERVYGDRVNERAAALAVHFARGQDYARAVHYHRQAAQSAFGRYAYQEAAAHLTAALEMLKALPDAGERTQEELVLQTTLGLAVMAAKGFENPEVEMSCTRVRELCQQAEDASQLFLALWLLWTFALMQGELEKAHALATQLLELARHQKDPMLLVVAHFAAGDVSWRLGEWSLAHSHFEQGISRYTPEHTTTLFSLYGSDPGAFCAVTSSSTLWILGYPEQALRRIQDAVTLARTVAYPFNLANALHFQCILQQRCGAQELAKENAAALLALAHEQGLAQWVALGNIDQGWILAHQGQVEEGTALIRQGLEAYRGLGIKIAQPYWLLLLAEAYHQGGQSEAGLIALTEALVTMDTMGERWLESELYRLRGELTLEKSGVRSPDSPTPSTPHLAPKQRQRSVFTKPSQLLVSSRRSPWSCGR